MTEIRLLSLALRIMGVYCSIRALESGVETISVAIVRVANPSIPTQGMFLAGVLPLLLFLSAACILIGRSESLAQRLSPRGEPKPVGMPSPSSEWYTSALSIIGIFLLIWLVPGSLARLVVNLSVRGDSGNLEIAAQATRGAWVIGIEAVLQTLLVLYLILGSKRIAEILQKIKVRP